LDVRYDEYWILRCSVNWSQTIYRTTIDRKNNLTTRKKNHRKLTKLIDRIRYCSSFKTICFAIEITLKPYEMPQTYYNNYNRTIAMVDFVQNRSLSSRWFNKIKDSCYATTSVKSRVLIIQILFFYINGTNPSNWHFIVTLKI